MTNQNVVVKIIQEGTGTINPPSVGNVQLAAEGNIKIPGVGLGLTVSSTFGKETHTLTSSGCKCDCEDESSGGTA
jgi:hypothetical protein